MKYDVYLVQEIELGMRTVEANNEKEAIQQAYMYFNKYDRDANGTRFEVRENDKNN